MTEKILLVDDERSIRDSLDKVLRAEGYNVLLAGDGQEAIEKLIQQHIDVLILDIGLPVKDGWATLRWLSQVHPTFPIILITGRWKQAELAEAAGVDVLMEKPLNIPALLQHIRELLGQPPELRRGKRAFQTVSCDIAIFCEHLLKRMTTPYSPDGPRHPE